MVDQIAADRLAWAVEGAEAIVIGAGAGLSASAGFDYSGERFTQWCKPWEDAYGVHDFYRAGFTRFRSARSSGVTGALRLWRIVTSAASVKCIPS